MAAALKCRLLGFDPEEWKAQNDQLKVEVHRLQAEVDRLTHELEELQCKQQQELQKQAPKTAEDWFQKLVRSFPGYSPPTMEDIHKFEVFGLVDDKLLAVYSASVVRTMSHYGWLYVSTNHVAFHSGMKTLQFFVPLDGIAEMRPGASMEAATMVFKAPLKVQGFKESMVSLDLQCQQTVAVALALWIRKKDGGGEDAADEEAESDEDDPSMPQAVGTSGSPAPEPSKEANPQLVRTATQVFADGEPFKLALEASVPTLSTDHLAQEFLSSEWGPDMVWVKFAASQGARDIAVSPACDDDGEDNDLVVRQVREIKMTIDLKGAAMCPPFSAFTQTIRVTVGRQDAADKPYVLIECSNITHDVPFGTYFHVQERTLLRPVTDGGVDFKKEMRVQFVKSVGLLKGQIRSGTEKSIKNGAATLLKFLSDNCGTAESKAVGQRRPRALTAAFTVHVYEAERRAGILDKDWRTPYLPNDSNRAWRWLDSSFKRHPWTVAGSRQEAAAAQLPPVDPGADWKPTHEWRVETSETTDEEGWQYALLFNKLESTWGLQVHGCTVRRRLWIRNYAEASSAASPADD